ncbi:hypothetical protein AJ80_01877 [Polytolypa hystricis UAMH7299]|uniref:Methyltransferase n=1 Tax=Polytolypa hystricis (strain UAMH7299) TaxID=1447883 RepID=A0A2B7YZG6_POLH7|nr:hypothetical protein AJ80_01877 [Polytolypa hystricis UAMH7299]
MSAQAVEPESASVPHIHDHPPLQADELEARSADDTDSAYEEGSLSSTSTSLRSSITNYQYENGRRYHAYKAGEYYLPNDETEQQRLELHHHIYRLCLSGLIYSAPIKSPQRVLDLGTGTGTWATEFADEFPSAEITGTDLSPIQPGWTPPNVKFYVDDFEQPWAYSDAQKFDYIHWRALSGSTGDFPKLYAQALENLKPGGWLEVQEYDAWVYSDDDKEMKNAPNTLAWCQTVDKSSIGFGKRLNVAKFQKKWMEEAGFVDVTEKVVKVPVGTWTKDTKLKEVGRYERLHMNESVEAHSMALYTRFLGYSKEEATTFFDTIKKEFNNRRLHLYTVYRFIVGRKPE